MCVFFILNYLFFKGNGNIANNLSQEQRMWILKPYWQTENAKHVLIAWIEAFDTSPTT